MGSSPSPDGLLGWPQPPAASARARPNQALRIPLPANVDGKVGPVAAHPAVEVEPAVGAVSVGVVVAVVVPVVVGVVAIVAVPPGVVVGAVPAGIPVGPAMVEYPAVPAVAAVAVSRLGLAGHDQHTAEGDGERDQQSPKPHGQTSCLCHHPGKQGVFHLGRSHGVSTLPGWPAVVGDARQGQPVLPEGQPTPPRCEPWPPRRRSPPGSVPPPAPPAPRTASICPRTCGCLSSTPPLP